MGVILLLITQRVTNKHFIPELYKMWLTIDFNVEYNLLRYIFKQRQMTPYHLCKISYVHIVLYFSAYRLYIFGGFGVNMGEYLWDDGEFHLDTASWVSYFVIHHMIYVF